MSTAIATRMPVITTYDPSFSPSSMHIINKPVGSRYEVVPHQGPGEATYCVQPTRAQLKANNGLFGSPSRPYWYCDPQNARFIDIDGKDCGPRWVYVDPKAGQKDSSNAKCIVM